MKFIQHAAAVAVLALASGMASAGDTKAFSALEGVDAQALSTTEMDAVYGALTLADIQAAINQVSNPYLQAFLQKEFNFLTTMYPTQVNTVLAILTRFGLRC